MAALAENDRLSGPFLATAGQDAFPADFPILKCEAVVVRIERGGEVLERTGAAVVVSAQSETGFTATVTPPCEAGDRVWVYSRLPAERRRAHTPYGAVRTQTLEGDAEEFQGQHQEARRDLDRALMFPMGERAPEFPLIAQRLETVPIFDINGDLQVMPIPEAVNTMGGEFADYGPWSVDDGQLTKDFGAFG